VTKESLYSGAIGIPTASPAMWEFADISYDPYYHGVSTASDLSPTAISSIVRLGMWRFAGLLSSTRSPRSVRSIR
jgi:hypothetical protein